MQQRCVNVPTLEQVCRISRRHDINIMKSDIAANFRTRADDISRVRRIFLASSAVEVRHLDIADREIRRELVAEREILLPVALRDLHSVVDVVDEHAVVGDVVDATGTSTTLQVAGESSRRSRPDFDARTVRGVFHCDVGDEDVLDYVGLAFVLAKRADADAVASVAVQILNDHFGAVRLEANAVVAIVDDAVLYDNVGTAVGIPSVSVLRRAFTLAGPGYVDVVVCKALTAGNPVVILR